MNPFTALNFWMILVGIGTICSAQVKLSRDIVTQEKWFDEIQKFADADIKNPPPQNSIVFVGSSSIRKWASLESDFPEYSVVRRGFGGSHMSDALYFCDRIVLPYKPKAVIVYEGDNDLNSGKSGEDILNDYQHFCRLVHAENPDCKIIFISVKASISRWELRDKIRSFNQSVKSWSDSDDRLGYVDAFDTMLGDDGRPRPELLDKDNLHLSPDGYKLWTSLVKSELNRLLLL